MFEDQKFIYNSISPQNLLYANQLTVFTWNDIINSLRLQSNETTTYLETLHKWLFGVDNLVLTYDKGFYVECLQAFNTLTKVQEDVLEHGNSIDILDATTKKNELNISSNHTNINTIFGWMDAHKEELKAIQNSINAVNSKTITNASNIEKLTETVGEHTSNLAEHTNLLAQHTVDIKNIGDIAISKTTVVFIEWEV